MIKWSVEGEDYLGSVLVFRGFVHGRSFEVRVRQDRVFNNYIMRLIVLSPVNDLEFSLLSTVFSHFNFTIDYIIDKKMIIIKPSILHHAFPSIEVLNTFINSLIQLLHQCIAHLVELKFTLELVVEFLNNGWIVDYDEMSISRLFKVYNIKGNVVKIEISPPKTMEIGKLRVDMVVLSKPKLINCIINYFSNRGLEVELFEDPGIAFIKGEYVSFGIISEIVKKLDKEVNELMRMC